MPSLKRRMKPRPYDYAWPPVNTGREYKRGHFNRMKQYWGRMQTLYNQPFPRRPRLPQGRVFQHQGNPYAYLLRGNSVLSKSARRIVCILKRRNVPIIAWDTRGIIYAAFASFPGHHGYLWIYVGMTSRTLEDRVPEHLDGAIDILNGKRQDGDPAHLRKFIARHGFSSIVFVPLQKVEGYVMGDAASFQTVARRYERLWISVLGTLHPHGFNKCLPGGRPNPHSQVVGGHTDLWSPLHHMYSTPIADTRFHYRNYHQTIIMLAQRLQHPPLHLAQQTTSIVHTIASPRLEKLRAIGQVHRIVAISEDAQQGIIHLISAELTNRAAVAHHTPRRIVKMVHPFYLSALMDRLHLQDILRQPEICSLLPTPRMKHIQALVGYKYPKP